MLRSLLSVTVLGAALSASFIAGGCATGANAGPNELAGTPSASIRPAPGTPKDQLTAQQVAQYSDQKGHFHAEWVGETGH
jgi:hypothetical protein